MRTPAGKECRFYYEDFHRGRSRQECRLLPKGRGSASWRPADCSHCPVPDILRANASEHLLLRAVVKPGLLGIGRHIHVTAYCNKHACNIADPYIGCSACASERPNLSDLFK